MAFFVLTTIRYNQEISKKFKKNAPLQKITWRLPTVIGLMIHFQKISLAKKLFGLSCRR